jgi:hypothetical protein
MQDKGARLEIYYLDSGAELEKVQGNLGIFWRHGESFPMDISDKIEVLLTHGYFHTKSEPPRGT